MNIAQQFRDQIGLLSGPLQAELDQLVASIQTGWGTEHDSDGHHADINATGTCTCQQLKLRGFVTLDVSGSATAAPLEVPAGVSFAVFKTPIIGTFDVYGVRQVGQKYGDVLFLWRDLVGGAVPNFHSGANSVFGAGTTPIGTEMILSSEPLTTGRPLKLIFLPMFGNGSSDAWVQTL
jgi:hypothetical protein